MSSATPRQLLLRDFITSLANTIEELPYLASDVVPDCLERGTIQLEISDDAGVWFHSQEMLELDYHALERRRFPCSAFPVVSSLIPEPKLHHSERSPVLTMLATFITGGLILAFNIHHSVSDGSGVRPLIKTFAKHTAALSEGRFVSSEEIFPEATLDRSIIFGGSGRKQICDIPNYRVSETYRFSRERALLEASITGDEKPGLLQKLQLSQWVVSDKSLLWMRELSSLGITTSSFVSPVNVRRRMDPPLPSEYPGNALVHAKTSAAVSDVESAEPGTLYHLAKQIANAIEWWTSERVWELIGAIESSAMVSKIEPNLDNFQGPDLELGLTAASFAVRETDRVFHYIFTIALLVGAVSYYAQASDLGWSAVKEVGGDTVRQMFYAKYINWSVAFPSIVLSLGLLSGVSWTTIVCNIFIAWIWVLTYLAAAYTTTIYKWGFFAFGTFSYIILAMSTLNESREAAARLGIARDYILLSGWLNLLWLLYPVAFGISDGSGVIGITSSFIFYGVLDVLMIPILSIAFVFMCRKWDFRRLNLDFSDARTRSASNIDADRTSTGNVKPPPA
ncbi:Thaumatin, pathogenesis-related protein [Purpureocillium lavendulum]|uniref:Thaumatin, pathogenesis-related protein n=1 Tax=Purpureocillium lavendulum TaxID=1247861 RepID=A0AB34FWC1_9HYPO|nr:Thaumatin, pathogenesis-related protein [Purpureocillium lavendulum]